jgi:YaiO family outer membrane protein
MSPNFVKKSILTFVLIVPSIIPSIVSAQDAPLQLKMTPNLEVGASVHKLSKGYGEYRSEFVRGSISLTPELRLSAEIANVSAYGSTGKLLVLGVEEQLDADWLSRASISSSQGGVTLPKLRFDFSLAHKWLAEKNLVTTVGGTLIQSKDGHSDLAFHLSNAYYFDIGGLPATVDFSVRHNISDPGSVVATSYTAAGSIGHNYQRIVSLRLDSGREAYQAIGVARSLVGFNSRSAQIYWREWINKDNGIQFSLSRYHNAYYDRNGIDVTYFKSF